MKGNQPAPNGAVDPKVNDISASQELPNTELTKPATTLTYLPGLDGLRALAVVAVMLYHAELTWIPGGFLGVDVFFVISGYLITSLMLAEWCQQGSLDLRAFWLRRARRLLPALFLMLAITLAIFELFLPDEVALMRGATLAALGYVTNWYFVLDHKSYFETIGRPLVLRHLWSLAIEEQFYLTWPLLFIVGMRLFRRRYMLLAILIAAGASATLMAILYQPDVDPSRIYYGTDTRAAGLLIGAALAFLWTPGRHNVPGRGLLLDLVGLAALGTLVTFYLRLDQFQPFLYQGGMACVALITAIIIAIAVDPSARLGSTFLGRQPLRWIGQRSYGMYLWHWPIFMLTRPQLDVPLQGWPLLALRLTITVVVVHLSYRYVETPIRNGALGKAWQALREARGGRVWQLRLQWAAAAGTIAALGVSAAFARPATPPTYLLADTIETPPAEMAYEASPAPPIPQAITQESVNLRTGPGTGYAVKRVLAADTPLVILGKAAAGNWYNVHTADELDGWVYADFLKTDASMAEIPTVAISSSVASATEPSDSASTTANAAQSAKPAPPVPVTVIGDSVMLGASKQIEQSISGAEVDAAIGRQASAAIEILRASSNAGQLGTVVVIHIGNNGPISARQFDQMMQVLEGVSKVVFINVKVPREWEAQNNAVLAQGVSRYPNAVLIDWHSASANHPEYFWDDGIHLRPEGAQVYTWLIAANIP